MKFTIAIFLLAALTGCASQTVRTGEKIIDPERHTMECERHIVELKDADGNWREVGCDGDAR